MQIGPLQLIVIGFTDPQLDGSILGSLAEASDSGHIKMGAMAGALTAADEYEYGLDPEAIDSVAEAIPAGGAAMLLVIEHTWAIDFRDAVRASGGILIAQDFLSPEALITYGALEG